MPEILKPSQQLISRLSSLKQKKYRNKYGEYLIEGEKTILEALYYGVAISCIFCSETKGRLIDHAQNLGVPVYGANAAIMAKLSDTKSPQSYLAYVKINHTQIDCCAGFYVALDGLSDPYNVGTIIRTADAFGAAGVMVSEDACDIYNPKVQRAAMGSIFHLPVEQCGLLEKLSRFKRKGALLLGTSPYGVEIVPDGFSTGVVIIGNEARGLDKNIIELCDVLFKIPMEGHAESLNASVAAGIALYVIKKNFGPFN